MQDRRLDAMFSSIGRGGRPPELWTVSRHEARVCLVGYRPMGSARFPMRHSRDSSPMGDGRVVLVQFVTKVCMGRLQTQYAARGPSMPSEEIVMPIAEGIIRRTNMTMANTTAMAEPPRVRGGAGSLLMMARAIVGRSIPWLGLMCG